MIEKKDSHGRKVNYLRLSITDRCNLRCRYCMPEEGVASKTCDDILSFQQFHHIVDAATRLGIRKVRVTGGEPLVRKGALDFIRQLADQPLVEEVALTTNGILLAECAVALKDAGLRTLNVSLDSLNPATFRRVTRGGSLTRVLDGLDSAEAAGLKIKLNMVVMKGVNDDEILEFAELGLTRPWSIRFIEYMPTIKEKSWREHLVSGSEVLNRIRCHYQLEELSGQRLCGPARPYRIAGAVGTIGIITPMSDHFCGSCNRIRVTASGLVKSCLLSNDAVDLKPYLDLPVEELEQVLLKVIDAKPAQHSLGKDLPLQDPFSMSSIGG